MLTSSSLSLSLHRTVYRQFTRSFREGVRPIASPNDDNVIVNACESKTYKVSHEVHERNRFWIKGQPYSVRDMLCNDPLHAQFIGGTIYQAFLSAQSYHRWHSPITGTIKKAYIIPGTYFSEPLFEDFNTVQGGTEDDDEKNEAGTENTSQEYLSVMATRAVIFIESDNPKIGLMAFMGIGMTEVSTCEIMVKEGQHVKKGDLIGR
jgi:phosphatidylserine decarboxylase